MPRLHQLERAIDLVASFSGGSRALYVGELFRVVAAGIVGIFEPIYITLLLQERGVGEPIAVMLLLYAAWSFLFGWLAPRVFRRVVRLGETVLIGGSFLALALYYVLLAAASRMAPIPLLLSAIVMLAIYALWYFPLYHLIVLRTSGTGSQGRTVGRLEIIVMLGGALSPLLGAWIISTKGFGLLYIVAAGTLVLSAIAYVRASRHWNALNRADKHPTDAPIGPDRLLRQVFVAEGIREAVVQRIWPMFLFGLALSYQQLGAVAAVELLAGLSVAVLVGGVIDRRGSGGILRLSVLLVAAVWMIRFAVISFWTALAAGVLWGVARPLMTMSFAASFYRVMHEAPPERQIDFILFREHWHHLGRAAILLAFAGLVVLDVPLRVLLLTAIPACLLLPRIGKAHWPGSATPKADPERGMPRRTPSVVAFHATGARRSRPKVFYGVRWKHHQYP